MNIIDIIGYDGADWMTNPNRNCAIPDEFTPQEAGAIADQWFPTEMGESRYAKRLCMDCPVARQCFLYAYNHPSIEGIWGGTTTGQRVKLRAGKQRKAA